MSMGMYSFQELVQAQLQFMEHNSLVAIIGIFVLRSVMVLQVVGLIFIVLVIRILLQWKQ